MCDLNAFVMKCGREELLLESVNSAVVKDGVVAMRNIFGEEVKVSGEIREISLLKNRIIVGQN